MYILSNEVLYTSVIRLLAKHYSHMHRMLEVDLEISTSDNI